MKLGGLAVGPTLALGTGRTQHPIASPRAIRAIASEANIGHRGDRDTAICGQGGGEGADAEGLGGTLDTVWDVTAEHGLR